MSSDAATLLSVLDTQATLLQEAAEALPHSFSQCTYSLGHIRQSVYLCLTCGETRGICSACSIACHTDHEQLELFPKRAFRCDCPTTALAHQCTLHTMPEVENERNTYGQNFKSLFCRCGRTYDAQKERETMIQCLACEDWLHESCLNLRERPSSREPTPTPEAPQPAAEEDDAASDTSSSGLPPPLIRADDYDCLVCSACVRKIEPLKRRAGTPGYMMVVRTGTEDSWRVIGQDTTESAAVEIEASEEARGNDSQPPQIGVKRELPGAASNAPEAKRARVSHEAGSPCLAPPVDHRAQELLSSLDAVQPQTVKDGADTTRWIGQGDVFLTEGWRERWCRCTNCLPRLRSRPYLLEEEETYEPPEDPDSGLSLEELGMRALQRLPREKAINGIMAFNAMRDDLMKHLRPFAEGGKEVTEADIRGFFDERMQARR